MLRLDRFLTLALFDPLARLTQNRELHIPILMYHSISNDSENGVHPYYRTCTSPEVFESHMKFLRDYNYKVISLSDAVYLLNNQRITQSTNLPINQSANQPVNYVVITFDDGFLDFYTDAFPILAHHGFTATVFMPTSFINAVDKTIMGKSFLSWSQVSELNNAGITFGSHTVSHNYLGEMAHAAIEQELRQSRETIEERTGSSVRTFSCPYAFPEHNKKFVAFLCNTLQDCGYSCAVTTRIGTAVQGDDIYTLKRIPVNTDDDLPLLQAKMSGGYNWMHAAQYMSKSLRDMVGLRRRKSLAKWTSP